MVPKTEFLNPKKVLVEEVVKALLKRCRKLPGGAASLKHVMLLVPTAQSGRQVRMALARAFEGSGVIAPRILQPKLLMVPAETSPVTASETRTEAELLAFLKEQPLRERWPNLFRSHREPTDVAVTLDFIAQLMQLWSTLSSNGLLMRAVAVKAKTCLEEAGGNEAAYWTELGSLEDAFFDTLHAKGLRAPAEAAVEAIHAPAPLPEDTEEVLIPSGLDPQPMLFPLLETLAAQTPRLTLTVLLHADAADRDAFDAWGRPLPEAWTGPRAPQLTSLKDEDILMTSSDAALAALAAESCAVPDGPASAPAAGLLDDTLFTRLETAFRRHGCRLSQSVPRRLASSAPGRLSLNLLTLSESDVWSWKTFAALLRSEDMAAFFRQERGDTFDRSVLLKALDDYQNAFLPLTVPDSFGPTEAREHASREDKQLAEASAALTPARDSLKALLESAKTEDCPDAEILRKLLERCYARPMPEGTDLKEFQSAAKALAEVLRNDTSADGPALSAEERRALLRRHLSEASYTPELSDGPLLRTEGWLELAWTPNPRIALLGMHEGVVPDAIVGHPFLPDRLRAVLGLKTNAERLARDTFLFSTLLSSRAPGDVKLFVSSVSDSGDCRKPSRLLFLCDNATLSRRVKRLFGASDEKRSTPARKLPDSWKLRLPDRPLHEPDHLSPTAIDDYLKCPFTYFLKRGLGMEPVTPKEEFAPTDIGTFIHAILKDYARLPDVNSRQEEASVRQSVKDIFEKKAAALYGTRPTVNLQLQLSTVRERLSAFATLQASLFAEGWKIMRAEHYVPPVSLGADVPYPVTGTIDRIDYKEGVGYRLIDYKTWSGISKAKDKVLSTSKPETDYADHMGLCPLTVFLPNRSKIEAKPARWFSVQLPLYGLALKASDPKRFDGQIADYMYIILGKNKASAETFGEGTDKKAAGIVALKDYEAEAVSAAKQACRRIRKGLFWPPAPSKNWQWDFRRYFLNGPEKDLADTDWVRRQEQLLTAVRAAEAEDNEGALE